MALARQRSRSQRRLPLAIEPSLPESWGQLTGWVHVNPISKLELALAAEIDRQNAENKTEHRKSICVKISVAGRGYHHEYRRYEDTTSIDINHKLALSIPGQMEDPQILGVVVHDILTRYDRYELSKSPVGDPKQTGEFTLVYRRKNVFHVYPFLRIRERFNLQKKAHEGETLRAVVNRMKALYGTPKCFLGNTAFRQPDGSFKLVRDLEAGGTVCLEGGHHALIINARALPTATVQDLVELTTDQASLRISANHPVETLGGPRVAKELRLGDRVLVGQRIRTLTRVRHYEEGAELFDIRFNPDGPIQAYVLPIYGMQVRGAAPPDPLNLVQLLQQVSADELMAALPEQYED